jgi:hypothetical protein
MTWLHGWEAVNACDSGLKHHERAHEGLEVSADTSRKGLHSSLKGSERISRVHEAQVLRNLKRDPRCRLH